MYFTVILSRDSPEIPACKSDIIGVRPVSSCVILYKDELLQGGFGYMNTFPTRVLVDLQFESVTII